MTEWVWLALVAIVLATLAMWLSWTANRLDRMHHRLAGLVKQREPQYVWPGKHLSDLFL